MPPENKPWEEFAVAEPNNSGNYGNARNRLSLISHVTHVELALNVVRGGLIRPQLVYDESKLNTDRILVVWLSPNHWNPGFRYGNVSFKFDWKKLVRGKNYYWVEWMPYQPKACRILITAKNRIKQHGLIPYDPKTHKGPWICDSKGEHFWNGDFTLEIMLECELLLSDIEEISFVDHHINFCCISHETCSDKGLSKSDAGIRFVSGLIARDLTAANLKLTKEQNGLNVPAASLKQGLDPMLIWPDSATCSGAVKAASPIGRALARAIFSAYHRNDNKERQALGQQFANRDELRKAMCNLVEAKFEVTS